LFILADGQVAYILTAPSQFGLGWLGGMKSSMPSFDVVPAIGVENGTPPVGEGIKGYAREPSWMTATFLIAPSSDFV
jgi:hypothetical protein